MFAGSFPKQTTLPYFALLIPVYPLWHQERACTVLGMVLLGAGRLLASDPISVASPDTDSARHRAHYS